VDEDDTVTMANLIVATTCNNEAMNRAVRRIADEYLSEAPEITEPLLNNIEVGIRAYDPCLSCATHALGQMPLEVTLYGHDGRALDRKVTSP
jgi:NAD-reducing hydrogenase large subunit